MLTVVCSLGDWAQDLSHARQVLCHELHPQPLNYLENPGSSPYAVPMAPLFGHTPL